jgi:hypothetical protein
MITIQTNETWVKQEDGTMLLISSEQVEVDILTPEEEIAQKEEELLKMYKEIQDLKNNL